MTPDETRGIMRFLHANGAFITPSDDTLEVWHHALRHFTYEQVKYSALHFLERHSPRDVNAAAIRAQVLSLKASGKVQETMCADHPEEVAQHCRCCAADILTRHRAPQLMGRPLTPPSELVPPPPGLRERVYEITTLATRDEQARLQRRTA